MQSLHVAISYFSRFLICLAEYIETSRSLSHSSQQIVVSDVAVGTMDGRGCVEVVSVVSVSVVSGVYRDRVFIRRCSGCGGCRARGGRKHGWSWLDRVCLEKPHDYSPSNAV